MQDNLLRLKVDGQVLGVNNFTFSHSLGNSVGSFEAELHTKEFDFLKTRVGKVVQISLGDFKRHCLLEQLAYEPQKELSIGGRDLISIMLDATAKPKSYADGVMLSSVARSICSDFGFSFKGSEDRKLKNCVVNKGETCLVFLERIIKPLILSTDTGKDIKVLEDLGKVAIKKGFKLSGIKYNHNITDVYESYEAVDGSHSWMPGWEKPKQKKVLGSGPKGKRKLFFSEKSDLASEAKNRESEAHSITLTTDNIFRILPGTILDIDTLGIKGLYKAKSIMVEISPDDISTQVTAIKK